MVVPMEDFISQANLHYFRAIKGGSVQIVMNVEAGAKANLKLKQLADVYHQENIKYYKLIPRIQPGVVKSLDNVSELSQGSCMFGSATKPGIISELEDFNMTLETFQKRCKKKKRRNHRDTETASNVEAKQFYLTQECDLEDSKLSKRRKKNPKHKTNSESTSSSVIKLGVPEACEDNYLVSKRMDHISTELECLRITEVVEEIIRHEDTRLALHCSPEPDSSGTVAIEEIRTTNSVDKAFKDASEEFNDAERKKTQNCLADNGVSREETESVVPQSSKSEIISQEVKEHEENKVSEPNLSMNSTDLEIMKKIESPVKLDLDCIGLPNLEFEVENTEIMWETETIAMDDLSESTGNSHSAPDDIRISLEEVKYPEIPQEQSSSSVNIDEAGDHKALDEVTTVPETTQPEKLLSGRKALSPSSQANLLKAMEHPKKKKRSKGKLYFSSQISHRILKAQGLESIDRVKIVEKPNKRDTHKLPRRDTQATKPEVFSSGCTSLKVCSKKAVAFSQGQMRNIQRLASKLTKDMKTMRQVTKRCLLTDTNTSNVSECNSDKVKILIRNSERNEMRSKKWLSMIERDCNRFCKIMGMVGENSLDTENIDETKKKKKKKKMKKKIKFADDVGGDLCHVKFFEIDMESE